MYSKREDVRSLLKRTGYKKAYPEFSMCPSLHEKVIHKIGTENYEEYFDFAFRGIYMQGITQKTEEDFKKYYKRELKSGTYFDAFGVAHEPGSKEAAHMTRMIHPLAGVDSLEIIKSFQMPDFKARDFAKLKAGSDSIKAYDTLSLAFANCSIWEQAWYIRSMEDLMADMVTEDEMAEVLLDKVTATVIERVQQYATAGFDIIYFGDDIGMQHTIMMSVELWETWLKPRLKKAIDAVKAIKPDTIIMYHSCGFVEPFINGLIECGVDVLNPIQSECMDFKEIHDKYGDRLSFYGTIGTQTTMPFSTPEEVKREVWKNLEIAGDKGGLLCSPTHVLEPEVPVDNVLAYAEACKSFK